MESFYGMNKGIIFFIGLLTGILCCVLIYRFDKKMFNRVALTKEKEIIITRVDTVYLEAPPKQKRQDFENKLGQSVVTENTGVEYTENQVLIYDSEFSFEGRENDEVFSDQLLETKTIKVILLFPEKQEGKLPENFLFFFEIQQWSTPIKNKLTYHRNKNMIKIKGMNLDNVRVVFWKGAYFLEVGNRYYAIPETESFEKLNVVNINP